VAAKQNRHEVLELLIAQHVDIERGTGGYNPLLISCASGSLKCVTSLLQAGAEIGACTRSKSTVFHVAAANGHLDVLKTLYKNLPKERFYIINSDDDRGDTPLHDAVANGHKAEAKFLLEIGALVNKSNNLGKSPFHYAALYGHTDIISLLIEVGADPEQRDNYSWTPLHIATSYNKLDFAQRLLEIKATLHLGARLETGETSLFLAAEKGHLEFLNFFLDQNEDQTLLLDMVSRPFTQLLNAAIPQ
jgi:ankyrin repeat protein